MALNTVDKHVVSEEVRKVIKRTLQGKYKDDVTGVEKLLKELTSRYMIYQLI